MKKDTDQSSKTNSIRLTFFYVSVIAIFAGIAYSTVVNIERERRQREGFSGFVFTPAFRLSDGMKTDLLGSRHLANNSAELVDEAVMGTIENDQAEAIQSNGQVDGSAAVQKLPPAPSSTAPKSKKPHGYIAPGLVASLPASYKLDSRGRMVCEKNNDKPGKSEKDKPTHIDMECCLDPDEIPNPHCYYPRDKYGSLLDRYHNEKKDKFINRVKGK